MDTCKFCGQRDGHLGACPQQDRSRFSMNLWNDGFSSSSHEIFIPQWTLRGYTPTFQLGYAMGVSAREKAAARLN